MTGNVAFVGFAAAGAAGLSAWVCLTALGGFLVGSLIGGRLARILEAVRHRWLAVALGAEAVLVGAVLVLSALGACMPRVEPAVTALRCCSPWRWGFRMQLLGSWRCPI